jgi:transposase
VRFNQRARSSANQAGPHIPDDDPGPWGAARWLTELGVTHVGMESTGVYWRPVYAVLKGDFEPIVGNVRHIRNVPGRKTDVKDAEWIADLVRHGLD